MPDQPQLVVYQLKIALRGISPLIWRRLLVDADTSLADLHHILQLAMGWTNSHLHRFLIRGQEYRIAYDGGIGFDDDPKQIRLANFRLRLRERFLYEYDFGNNWQHDIRVEQIVAADTKRRSPVCIGGGSVATLHLRDVPLCCSRKRAVEEGGMINFKGSQFEREIILWGVRWYVAYPISYRQLEEMMGERGVAVDHSTLNRWVIKYAPEFEKQFRCRRRPVGGSWRLDETYVKIKGKWAYLYRAVDKEGHTIDFLLTPQRDRASAEAFLHKAIRTQGLPEKITIDRSGSNTAAIKRYNKAHKTAIIIRHSKYLNNLIEQDQRAVKRLTRPMLGFKSFWAARCTIAGLEVMHAIRKGQLVSTGSTSPTPAEQFYALAA
jgi:transposase-like protein